jgi:hypothetical protein
LSAPRAVDRGRCADRPACAGRRQIALLEPPPDLHGGAAAGAAAAKPAKAPWVLTPVTQRDANHYNPFLAPGGRRVGYHRCRSHGSVPTLARHDSPVPGAGGPRCATAVRQFSLCPRRAAAPPCALNARARPALRAPRLPARHEAHTAGRRARGRPLTLERSVAHAPRAPRTRRFDVARFERGPA